VNVFNIYINIFYKYIIYILKTSAIAEEKTALQSFWTLSTRLWSENPLNFLGTERQLDPLSVKN